MTPSNRRNEIDKGIQQIYSLFDGHDPEFLEAAPRTTSQVKSIQLSITDFQIEWFKYNLSLETVIELIRAFSESTISTEHKISNIETIHKECLVEISKLKQPKLSDDLDKLITNMLDSHRLSQNSPQYLTLCKTIEYIRSQNL